MSVGYQINRVMVPLSAVGHWGRLAFRGHLTLHLPRGASLDSVDYIGLHSSIRDS